MIPAVKILMLLMIASQSTAPDKLTVQVPRTASIVMVDGVLSKGEWESAAHLDVPGVARIYFQTSTQFVYIAVEFKHSPSGIVDLYLSPRRGEIQDLHVSAKLGERQRVGNAFPIGPGGTTVIGLGMFLASIPLKGERFCRPLYAKYQIRRSPFAAAVWCVRFELTAMGADNEIKRRVVFPSGTSEKSTSGWLRLDL